ncbi:MAG: trypsin-like peptidase domain-containing protein [Caldilineales bacterium]|nr:trypsin-like peptidase domain-containing protein [Caldilineales bacterium]
MTQTKRTSPRAILAALILAFVLPLTACTVGVPKDTEPLVEVKPVAATVDTDAIIDQVLVRLAQATPAAASSELGIDVNAIIDQVVARIEAQNEQRDSTLQVGFGETVGDAQVDVELEQRLIDLYRRTNPAVVYIIVPPVGSGSGFVFDDEGHIVTNNHVVDGGQSYEVVFANGERRSARLTGRDIDSDLAVLQVQDLPAEITPLPLAAPGDVQVGQFVIAIGNPFGEQGSMSLGIVSGLDRSLRSRRSQLARSYSLPQVIQTDAPINPGNSGGPLLNLDGEVVGVNSAIATDTGTNSGVGFSIPAAAVARIAPSLISEGGYVYPHMGVSFVDEISLADAQAYDLPQIQGAYVVGITPGGPADVAGLRAADPNTGRGGDLVIEIDGQAINSFSDLNSYLLLNASVGQTIHIKSLRNGKLVELELTLGERP